MFDFTSAGLKIGTSRIRSSPVLGIAFLLAIASAGPVFARPLPLKDQTPPAAGPTELFQKLKALPGVQDVSPARGNRQAGEAYDVTLLQPLDHRYPGGEMFPQHIFVSHAGFDRPTILATEGYAARGAGSGGELGRILNGANVVTVEHRFCGRSVPASPIPWKHLTVKQSADDLHTVTALMKTIYKGKWISTGASKGGQTALFYKCYYPGDMDAVVAYVAPINIAQEDPRIYRFIRTIGDAETRQKIKNYQIALLKNKDRLVPLIQKQDEAHNVTYAMGIEAAFEYGVLEYPFAFWQYGTPPVEIPSADAPVEALLAHYNKVGAMRYYSDQGRKPFEPFMYQAFTEIGYYNYDIDEFKGLLSLKNPTNQVLCPAGAEITYDPSAMAFVYNFLQYHADRVVYIYGELDMWSATQIELIGRTDALKFIVKDAHHGAGVRGFSDEQKALFFEKMEKWLGLELNKN